MPTVHNYSLGPENAEGGFTLPPRVTNLLKYLPLWDSTCMHGSRLITALILKLILLIVLAQTMYPDVAYTGAMSACIHNTIYTFPLLMLHLIEIVINVTSMSDSIHVYLATHYFSLWPLLIINYCYHNYRDDLCTQHPLPGCSQWTVHSRDHTGWAECQI